MQNNNNKSQSHKTNIYPLTVGQKGLWLLHQMDPLSDRYHMPLTFKLAKEVNIHMLEKVLGLFIKRHSIMSSNFQCIDNETVRVINPINHANITEHEISQFSEQQIVKKIRSISSKPFDLENGPLIRSDLFKGYHGERLWLICIHHIIFDGASLKIMFNELQAIYQAILDEQPLPEPVDHYHTFVEWQGEWLCTDEARISQQYWLKKFDGQLPRLNLPKDLSEQGKSIKGDFLKFDVPKELTEGIRTLAKNAKCSEYFAWLMAYTAFLSRYSSESDIIIGTPVMGRAKAQFDEMIGYFVNMVPLRFDIDHSEKFNEILLTYKNDMYEALSHSDYPLAELIKRLADMDNRGDQPLFQTSFIWTVTEHLKQQKNSTLKLSIEPVIHESGEQDLCMEIIASKNQMYCLIKYRTHLFLPQTIDSIKDSFLIFLQDICQRPDVNIAQLALISQKQKNKLTQVERPQYIHNQSQQCIHHILELQAIKIPQSLALIYANESLTFQQLNTKANRLAHYFKKNALGCGSIIGLYLDRSINLIIGMMGILKSGAAYLPIDNKMSIKRLQFIVNDSGAQHILTEEKHKNICQDLTTEFTVFNEAFDQKTLFELSSENLMIEGLSGENLAYVIYTSGSTGKPKGVLQKHETIVNLVHAQAHLNGPKTPMNTLQFSPISFDVSVQEVATSLFTASSLMIIDDEEKVELNNLTTILNRLQIGRMFLPPAVMNILAEHYIRDRVKLERMREIIVAGEALTVTLELKQFMLDHEVCQLWNHYGPTETHVASIAKIDVKKDNRMVSIGHVLPHLSAYVLDSNQQILPIGAVGELYVVGSAVAKGYLNRKNLTAKQFMCLPFTGNQAVYKTGDFVRYLHDGQLTFIGREDDQVKIRGFRIELDEIAFRIDQLPYVEKSVVVVNVKELHNNYLVAYVIPQQPDISHDNLINKIRQYLNEHLPDYMIPVAFQVLHTLPLTSNGKIDRKQLPRVKLHSDNNVFEEPKSPTARQLAKIWADLLLIKAEHISATAVFFELGGHSLLVTKMINAVDQNWGVQLKYNDVFQYTALRDLSLLIDERLQKKSLLNSLAQQNDDAIDELEW